MSDSFYLGMREKRIFYIRCASCNNKEEVEVWGGNVCAAEDDLNALLNNEGWARVMDDVLCPDCKPGKAQP